MNSLVLEIQKDAITQQAKVSDLLRKSLVAATKLNLKDFEDWIEKELRGYSDDAAIPKYRNVIGEVKAYNPYHGWQPVIFESEEMGELFSRRKIGQPVGELEKLLDHQGEYIVTIPESIKKSLIESVGAPIYFFSSRNVIYGILEAVRNVILEWSLRLEKDGILGEGLIFSNEEKETAEKNTYNIQNFTGVLGNVHSTSFQIGDYTNIHTELKRKGIRQEERNELENILDELKKANSKEKKSLVARGTEWLKRNSKCIGPVLTEVIKGWLGL